MSDLHPVTDIHPDIDRILISQEEINARIAELGAQISADYQGEELLLVCILKGAFVFMADLARAITVPVQTGFIAVSSYGHSTQSSGVVRIMKDLDQSVEGQNVLIVEDIVDTGLTLAYIASLLHDRHPKSLKICALTNKPQCRKKEVTIDYCGFVLPNEFVVGYGLDYQDYYRNLPYIGVLKPSRYAQSHG
ncbi:MAG: Hypoxanthine-guanine phosphoribosyltransferase [Candidatus Ozemobacter sibiricus]|uniref:Hypoxanthine phosphoribosyltransferase n=1 Tax=Candidatus Ozemobacter sibiricus TaxID=2268124 RepID=A0A367ZUN0_9BACT|nr:MAG: Hypoxanthine-guanine phosphoribosyltransferase [Candidatus Ozemobacter sibiricus]